MTATLDHYAPVPQSVLDRWPDLDPARPETTPEPDACVEGRPWGHAVYGGLYADTRPEYYARRWENYLAWYDAGRKRGWGAPCRNRASREPEHMCGTHSNAYRDQRARDERARATAARLEEHTNLAKRLAEVGVTADAYSDSIRLSAESARQLINSLACAQLDRDVLRHLLEVVETVLINNAQQPVRNTLIGEAASRARRHLSDTTDPEGA